MCIKYTLNKGTILLATIKKTSISVPKITIFSKSALTILINFFFLIETLKTQIKHTGCHLFKIADLLLTGKKTTAKTAMETIKKDVIP